MHSPLSRNLNMNYLMFHYKYFIGISLRPSRNVSKHTFLGSPIKVLLTMTQTMTMCSAFEHFMNGKGAI